MSRYLVMRLRAPLMSFGGESVDAQAVVRDFPALSMVTGLLANALGLDRSQPEEHQALQDDLVMACARLPGGIKITDFQTSHLCQADQAWTTDGVPLGRRGGPNTFQGQHLRWKDFVCDGDVLVALSLRGAGLHAFTLDGIAQALDRPFRPLFIGRKGCVPTERLFAGWIDSDGPREALLLALRAVGARQAHLQWPAFDEASFLHPGLTRLCDERRWEQSVHGGLREVVQEMVEVAS